MGWDDRKDQRAVERGRAETETLPVRATWSGPCHIGDMTDPKALRDLSIRLQDHGKELRRSCEEARDRSNALREWAEEARRKAAAVRAHATKPERRGHFQMAWRF